MKPYSFSQLLHFHGCELGHDQLGLKNDNGMVKKAIISLTGTTANRSTIWCNATSLWYFIYCINYIGSGVAQRISTSDWVNCTVINNYFHSDSSLRQWECAELPITSSTNNDNTLDRSINWCHDHHALGTIDSSSTSGTLYNLYLM